MERDVSELQTQSKMLRTDGNLELWTTPYGLYWMTKGTANEEFYVLSEQTLKLDPLNILHSDIIIDCGANIGAFAREALKRGAAAVIAVEPGPDSLTCLKQNLQSEIQKGKVILYPKGVMHRDGALPFHGSGLGASFIFSNDKSSNQVLEFTTVDTIVAELKLPKVDILKMDIEGAEPQALLGSQRTLARFKPRLAIAVEHSLEEPEIVRGIIQKLVHNYTEECGWCFYFDGRFNPDILFFR